jgi:hypothetical protein
MRILAMEWVDGDRFDTILRAPGRGVAWKDQVGGLLEDSRDLWTAFDEVLGGESDSGSGELRQTWESAFSTLTKIGLDERTADSLTGRVSQLTLPSVPQHGDLWPRNIMRGENRWWFMDFETCGEVSFPLYDVFHLLRGAARFAPGRGRRSWLRRLAEDEAHLPSLQRSLRGQAQGLTSKQVEGALICYLADFSCRLHKRGISPKKIAPWLKGLAALPEFLEKKGVGDVLLGGAAGTRSSVRGG